MTKLPSPLRCPVPFQQRDRGGREMVRAGVTQPPASPLSGRVPRVAKLMALALGFEELLRTGVVGDHAELARLGQVSRARISQIMNLLHLAPDLQEALLFLPRPEHGRDPLPLRLLQPIATVANWKTQRRLWRQLALRHRPALEEDIVINPP